MDPTGYYMDYIETVWDCTITPDKLSAFQSDHPCPCDTYAT